MKTCPVAHDSLQGVPRQQTNPALWNGKDWGVFVADLKKQEINVRENRADRSLYRTDGGGVAQGMPHGLVIARSAKQIAAILRSRLLTEPRIR